MPRTLALVALTIALLLAATSSASIHHYDSLLAPAGVCRGQTDTRRSVDDQEWTIHCMHNHVRSRRGLPHLQHKEPAPERRGREVRHIVPGVRSRGLRSRNLRLDRAQRLNRPGLGLARIGLMSAWLHSDPHRHSLFKPRYRNKGVGLVKGTLRGYPGSLVWTTQLGYLCCDWQ